MRKYFVGTLVVLAGAWFASSRAEATTVAVGCDIAELKQAIVNTNAAPGPDTLTLAVNCVYSLTTVDNEGVFGDNGLPVITDDLVIEGQWATIQRAAGNEIPVFRLIESMGSENDLTIRNLTLRNGCASTDDTAMGGAVKVNGALLIENSTIVDNIATSTFIAQGGAVAGVDVTISNSTLSGNRASGPGASYGGGIHAGQSVTLNDAVIDDNRAVSEGGFAYGGGISAQEMTVIASTITNNAAIGGSASAGGMGSTTSANVSGSTVSDNNATATSGLAQAGGINANTLLSLMNTTVSGNSAAGETGGRGGGVAAEGDTTITRSTISNNVASGAAGNAEGGGAITNGGMTIVNSTISGNAAAGATDVAGSSLGGGVLSVVDLDISNSTFSGNFVTGYTDGQVTSYRGGSFFAINPGTIENSIFASGFPANCDAFGSSEIMIDARSISTDDSCDEAEQVQDAGLLPLAITFPGKTKTHLLEQDSPALGKGSGCEETDQRGVMRDTLSCDSGAVELILLDPSPYDVDCDGEETSADILAGMRALAGYASGELPSPPCDADVDGDSDVDLHDVMLLRRRIAGLVD